MPDALLPEFGFVLLVFTVAYWGAVAMSEAYLVFPWDR